MQRRWLRKQLKIGSSNKEFMEQFHVKNVQHIAKPETVLQQEHDLELKKTTVGAQRNGADIESNTFSNVNKIPRAEQNLLNMKTSEHAQQATNFPFFIHARHTCDGCSKTPIIGTRYTAIKIPDFDLCEACFSRHKKDDLDFKPETLGKTLRFL